MKRSETHCAVDIQEQSPVVLWGSGAMRFAYCALRCDLWRHQTGEEIFEFEVEFPKDGEARGLVECTVHAENLTRPEQARVIVSRTIEPLSMIDSAEALVEACK